MSRGFEMTIRHIAGREQWVSVPGWKLRGTSRSEQCGGKNNLVKAFEAYEPAFEFNVMQEQKLLLLP